MLTRVLTLCLPAAFVTLLDALLCWRHLMFWTDRLLLLLAIAAAGVLWPLIAAAIGILRDPGVPTTRVVIDRGAATILAYCLNALFIGIGILILRAAG